MFVFLCVKYVLDFIYEMNIYINKILRWFICWLRICFFFWRLWIVFLIFGSFFWGFVVRIWWWSGLFFLYWGFFLGYVFVFCIFWLVWDFVFVGFFVFWIFWSVVGFWGLCFEWFLICFVILICWCWLFF